MAQTNAKAAPALTKNCGGGTSDRFPFVLTKVTGGSRSVVESLAPYAPLKTISFGSRKLWCTRYGNGTCV